MARQPERRATRTDLLRSIPAIDIDQGRARNWGDFAGSMFAFRAKVHDELDSEARIDGWRRGFSGDLNDGLMFSPTIRGEAYTQQAMQSYFTEIEASARARMEELAAEHRNDPQGMQVSVDAYINEITKDLPAEFAGKAGTYLTATSRPYVAKARADMVKLSIGQAQAQALVAERTATLQIDRLARGMFSGNVELAATSRHGIEAVRARLGAMYSSTVEDDLGNRVPVFSPEARAKALIAMEERVAKGTLVGWYEEQPDKLRALQDLSDGRVRAPITRDGKVVGYYDPMGELPAEDAAGVIRQLRSAFSSELSIANTLQSMADRAERRRDEAAIVALHRSVMNGSTDATRIGAERLLATTRFPATAREARKIVEAGGVVGDPKNTPAYLQARLIAMRGEFDVHDYAHTAGLPLAEVADLIGVNQQARDRLRGMSPTTSARYRDAEDLIAGYVANMNMAAIQSSLMLGQVRPEQAKALGWAVKLQEAALDAHDAGQPFDPVAWVRETIAPRTQGKAEAMRAVTQQVQELRTALRARSAELMRGGGSGDYTADPEWQRINREWAEAEQELERLRLQGDTP